MKPVYSRLAPVLILISATIAIYGQILGHEFISNWDDSFYVTNNPFVQGISWSNIRAIFSTYHVGNYAPVQMLSYMLDYSIWGLWAGGFLLTNLIIHTINGLLFYHLLLRFHNDRLMAFIGSAVFLLHPVQVESVAWISQRKNVLAMLFFLVAWEGYCRYRDAEPGRGKLAYAASVVSFTLALLSKSVAVIFPVVLILFDVCFFQETARPRLKDKVPFILAAAAVAVLALVSQQVEHGGGRTGFHGGSPLATFFTMLPVLCRYMGMAVWPTGLSAEYDPAIHQNIDVTVAGAALLLAVVAVACGVLLKRDRRPGFWALLFFVGLLPVSQIVPLVTLINDRYLYFPMLGFAALCAGAGVSLLRRFETSCGGAIKILLAGLLALLAVASWQRAKVWKDDLSLFKDASEKSPTVFTAWFGLGSAYQENGTYDMAITAYERAEQLKPDSTDVLWSLGNLYVELGMPEAAFPHLKRLLEVNPSYVRGWASMGNYYRLKKEFPRAQGMYLKALELQPDAVEVLMNLARLAAYQGDVESALVWLERAFAEGWRDYSDVDGDRDFGSIQDDPRFISRMMRLFPRQKRND